MAAYLVALGTVHDEERFAKYVEAVGPTLAAHGGEPLAVDGAAEVTEGNPSHSRVVVLKFPSKEHAKAWEESPEYQAAKQHRLASSDHVIYLLDEFVMPSS